jgi:hypothetical protein
MIKQLEIYKKYLLMLHKTGINSIICHSKAGYGKTYTTIKTLQEHGIGYEYMSGVTTAVELYKLLFNNNGKIIILDDVETIFQDDRIINLLKASLWGVDNNRVVTYKTSSKVLQDYPDSFIFTGKIIILANEIKGKQDESFNALISRSLKYELKYSLKDIINLCKQTLPLKKLTLKQELIIGNFLDNQVRAEYNFNLRVFERLIEFVKYDINNGIELFLNSLEIDEEVLTMINIIGANKPVDEQVNEYIALTGKSRRSFFRKKQKMKRDGAL